MTSNNRPDGERYEVRFGGRDPLRHYKLVVRSNGSFAVRCLETDRYVAGYDADYPETPIPEAARRIYSMKYGEFYTLFLRCTSAHLEEQIRREYERVVRLMPKDSAVLPLFPENAIRLSVD